MDRGVSRGFMSTLQVYSELGASPACGKTLSRILKMRAIGAVSSLHAITQLVVASDLCSRGFSVEAEALLGDGVVADIYAVNGDLRLVVEIESGYIPSRWITRAEEYLEAKVAWKALRLSRLDVHVLLATPSHVRIPIPLVLLKPPGERSDGELAEVEEMIRSHYPRRAGALQIAGDAARRARLDGVALVNITEKRVTYALSRSSSPELRALLR